MKINLSESSFENLRTLEAKINKAYNKCRNVEFFFETKRGSKYEQQWRKMIIDLRGWDEFPLDEHGNNLTKPAWIEYCGNQIYTNYSLGDVCA